MVSRVVVLAGGGSRRMGRDKLAADLAGVPVLDRLLAGLAAALPGVPVLAVGPGAGHAVPVSGFASSRPGAARSPPWPAPCDGLGDG